MGGAAAWSVGDGSRRAASVVAAVALALLAAGCPPWWWREEWVGQDDSPRDAAGGAGGADEPFDAGIPGPIEIDAPEPHGPSPGDAWRQLGHDASRTGRSGATVASTPSVVWKVALQGPEANVRPVVDDDGVYVSTGRWLYAIDASGGLRWKIAAGPMGWSAFGGIALDQDGSVLATVNDTGHVLRLRSDGSLATHVELPHVWLVGPPVLGDDGTAYVVSLTSGGPRLDSISPEGDVVWSVGLGAALMNPSIAALDDDGSIYVALSQSGSPPTGDALVKVTTGGEVAWSRFVLPYAQSPSFCAGRIWIVSQQIEAPNVLLYSKSGDLLTSVDVESVVQPMPACHPGGWALLNMAHGVLALTPEGQTLWHLETAPYPSGELHFGPQAALDAAGVLVASDASGALRGVRDGKVTFVVELESDGSGVGGTPAIGPDGTIYVSGGPLLYAIR